VVLSTVAMSTFVPGCRMNDLGDRDRRVRRTRRRSDDDPLRCPSDGSSGLTKMARNEPSTPYSTERRRSRTYRAVGCTTAPVLKTSWATGPMPLRDEPSAGFPAVGSRRSAAGAGLCPAEGNRDQNGGTTAVQDAPWSKPSPSTRSARLIPTSASVGSSRACARTRSRPFDVGFGAGPRTGLHWRVPRRMLTP